MVDAEGAISELKNEGTLARAQRRGTPHFHVQLLLGCTAINCKRLADHAPQAQSAAAAGPGAAEKTGPTAARWLAALLTAPPRTWDHTISIN